MVSIVLRATGIAASLYLIDGFLEGRFRQHVALLCSVHVCIVSYHIYTPTQKSTVVSLRYIFAKEDTSYCNNNNSDEEVVGAIDTIYLVSYHMILCI